MQELDEEHDDFLSFAAALDREIFTASERSKPLSKRDKIKVKWMTEVIIFYLSDLHLHPCQKTSIRSTIGLPYTYRTHSSASSTEDDFR